MLYEDLMGTWCEFFDGCIYNLNYESLTTDPEKEIKLLLDNIDLDWNDACLAPQDNKRFVKTASIQQVNKKIYKGSSEDWKKYEKFLSNVFSNF